MKAILIDDEPLALQFLERQLEKIGHVEVIDRFTRFVVRDEIDLLHNINVVFLDIEMPEINGLEMAERIIEVNPNIIIVFVTAYNNYAIQAFELNAIDYILKPARIDRLKKTITRIMKQLNNTDKTIQRKEYLKIQVSGELAFHVDKELVIIDWRTAKARELFLYLLLNKKQVVRKADLVELFWGEFEQEKAYSLLYTTIYHVRKALQQFQNNIIIKNKQEGYILITNDVFIDLIEWEKELNILSPINEYNVEQYEKVMNLYVDSYLQNYDYIWAETERFRLENKWVAIALKISKFHLQNTNYQKAESWLIHICEVRPEEEDAHFSLMKLYAALDYGILVKYQYEKLQHSLQDIGIQINEQIEHWYNEWNQ